MPVPLDRMMTGSPAMLPPPVPRIAMPNPHNRKPSLSKSLLNSQAQEEGRGSTDAEYPVPSVPSQYQHMRSLSPPIDMIGQAVSTSSPIDGSTPVMSSAAQRYVPAEHHGKPFTSSPDPASNDSGYLSSSSLEKSPVVPIRSMFPTYNPAVSLQQQSYYPTRPNPARTFSLGDVLSQRHSFMSGTMTPVDRGFNAPSAPLSVAHLPLEALDPIVSNQRELAQLWEATHGMEPNALIRAYDLEFARTDEATFTLGSDPSIPFYSMTTYDTNEIAVSKIHPRKQNITVEVSLNTIEPAARRVPPQDGMITFIFPKMAAMLAINQSTSLAKEHGLAPTHRDEVQAAAVRRAADQEACKLRWNAYAQHYELEHPAINRRQRGPDFAKSPETTRSPMSGLKSALTISIHSTNSSLPVITVSSPQPSDLTSEPSPSIPGIRMSTLPNPSTDTSTLAVLDFNTRILHLEANRILETLPSLFAIDSIVSALLTIAVADESINPVMAQMELWTPKPRRAPSQWGGSVAPSTTGSVLYATLAEREEAEAEARELAELHEKDIRNGARGKSSSSTHKGWFGKKEKKPKQKKGKTKQIVIKDFDLEKLGHYQAGGRKGQELPGITRVALGVLVGGLKMIVMLLTMIVQVLSWILVNATRCFTSEKF